jgi:hypothetical protein
MWVWKSRTEYHRRAVALLRKSLIEREDDPEIYRITAHGISVANVPAMASADTQTPQANGQP